MAQTSEKLGLTYPAQDDYYDVDIFNENWRRLEAQTDIFEENTVVIAEDGASITETYPSGRTITRISGSVIVEDTYNKNDVLTDRKIVSIDGNSVTERRGVIE